MLELISTHITPEKLPTLPYFSEDDEHSTLITARKLVARRLAEFVESEQDSTVLSEQPKQEIGYFDITPVEGEDQMTKSYHPNLESEEVEADNTARIKLLARKYARKVLSKEDIARLEIVTERIRLLIPRITSSDFEQLALIAEEIQGIRDADDDVRKKLGFHEK